MQNTVVLLYTTLGCHLCELAKQVLWQIGDELSVQLKEVEISDSDSMMERYGTRIPVISVEGSLLELNWPFSVADARAFVISSRSAGIAE